MQGRARLLMLSKLASSDLEPRIEHGVIAVGVVLANRFRSRLHNDVRMHAAIRNWVPAWRIEFGRGQTDSRVGYVQGKNSLDTSLAVAPLAD